MQMSEIETQSDSKDISAIDHQTYSSILLEYDVTKKQREARCALLEAVSAPNLNDGNTSATIGHISHDSLSSSDIPVIGSMLLKVGDVHTLNLVLHSPGGDGTAVEPFVSLCRTHCQRL